MGATIADLDIDLLLTFDALLDSNNVTQAARKLGITQPALSARLARLREVFGDRLFIPGVSGRGVVPTARALDLQPAIQDVVTRLRALTNPAPEFDPSQSGRTFVIAVLENPAVMLAPGLVPRVRALAPAVRLAVVLPNQDRLCSDLESGKVDLFVGGGKSANEALISRTLFNDDFLTAQRRDHPRGHGPLSLQEFCELEHLLVSVDGAGFSGLVDDALALKDRKRKVAVSVQSYALAPIILANSDLVCTLPRRFLDRFAGAVHAVHAPLELGRLELSAYWHERSRQDPGHKWLRQQIFATARATGRR